MTRSLTPMKTVRSLSSRSTLVPLMSAAGADVLVAGSATFKGGPDHYAANIAALKGNG